MTSNKYHISIGPLVEVPPSSDEHFCYCSVAVTVSRNVNITAAKMINWKALDNVPLLFYILALKTLVLCLGFAAVKIYQSRKADAELKKQKAERTRLAQKTQELLDNLKED